MTITYALLGLLNRQPLSGYDLKKIISADEMYFWSGNNNQIYKSLVQLHRDGWVQAEVQQQASLPAKKVYSLTVKGRAALREWVMSMPELPEFRCTFHLQLALSGPIPSEELADLIAKYEEEIKAQVILQNEVLRRAARQPASLAPDTMLRQAVAAHRAELWQHELDWVHRLQNQLNQPEEETQP